MRSSTYGRGFFSTMAKSNCPAKTSGPPGLFLPWVSIGPYEIGGGPAMPFLSRRTGRRCAPGLDAPLHYKTFCAKPAKPAKRTYDLSNHLDNTPGERSAALARKRWWGQPNEFSAAANPTRIRCGAHGFKPLALRLILLAVRMATLAFSKRRLLRRNTTKTRAATAAKYEIWASIATGWLNRQRFLAL